MKFKPSYRPAALVEGRSRWYIKLYAPSRFRKTFDLNRILNIDERRRRGKELVSLLNWWLKVDLPIDQFDERAARRRKSEAEKVNIAPRGHTLVGVAIRHAVELKRVKTRLASVDSFISNANIFIDFLEAKEWDDMPIDELEQHHIMAFVDHRQLHDKVSGTTVNNNITLLGSLFSELLDRGFIVENHWHKIKKVKRSPKKRRPFTMEEARAVIQYAYRNDPLLCLAILLQYCCFVRPNEIRNLKIGDVNIGSGIITIRSAIGKTGNKVGDRFATIPDSFKEVFRQLAPKGRKSQYIFGKGFKKGEEPCNKNRMNKRHRSILERLRKNGQLVSLEGLSFYSWKDTGITEALSYMNVIDVKNQAGHTDTRMTLKYYKKPELNPAFRELKNELLVAFYE